MGVLESVLNYKAQQQAQAAAQNNSITNALSIFQQARQQATENNFKALLIKSNLAEKGIKLNTDGSFSRDSSLQSPLDALIEKGKAADAARTLGDRGLFSQLTQPTTINQNLNPIVAAQTPPIPNSLYDQSVETDAFTGKPTGRAMQAKDQLDLQKQKNELEQKAQVPTVQQRNDLTATENQLTNLNNLKKLADKVPAGRIKGSISAITSSVSGGELETNTRQYLKERPAFAVSIYRALTGDTRLSDADAKARALPLLWHPTESEKIRKQSFDTIQKAMEARKNLILQGRYTQDKDGQFITPLQDVLAEANGAAPVNPSSPQPSTPSSSDGTVQLKKPFEGLLPESFGPNKTNLRQNAEDMIAPAAAFINSALSVPFTDISPKNGLESLGISYPESSGTTGKITDTAFGGAGAFANLPVRGIAALMGMSKLAKLGISTARATQAMSETAPIAAKVGQAAEELSLKVNPPEKALEILKNTRNNLTKTGGYIDKEHQIYSKSLDLLKGSKEAVKNSNEVVIGLDELKNSTNTFESPAIGKVYNTISDLSKKGKLTEENLVDLMKQLGKSGGTANRMANKEAISVIAKGLSGKAAQNYSSMQSRYSAFKSSIDTAESVLGKLTGKNLPNDLELGNHANTLLKIGENPASGKVLQQVADISGVKDFANTVTKLGGLQKFRIGVSPYAFGIRIKNLLLGGKQIAEGAPLSSGEKLGESAKTLDKLKGQVSKMKTNQLLQEQNKNTLSSLVKQEAQATKANKLNRQQDILKNSKSFLNKAEDLLRSSKKIIKKR